MDFNLLNQYFDHIYVVTLRRAAERHLNIQNKLNGLNYQFFFGADNKEFSVHNLEEKNIYNSAKAKAVHRYNKPMQSGVLGCSLSHRMVYNDILAHGYKQVLILEDDVESNAAGIGNFAAIIKELPENWELLYFDYNKHTEANFFTAAKQNIYHLQKLFGGLKWSHTTINNLYAKPFSQHLKIAGYHDYTSAYAVTYSAAAKLVQLQTPVVYVADHLLAHAATNKIVDAYIAVPKLFEQESQKNKSSTGSYAEET